MRYMMLIYSDEVAEANQSQEERSAVMERYFTFTDEVRQRGVFNSGDELQPTATATTVRVRDGRVTPQDGPYVETKEQLGGYYILDCANLDEAIEFAAKIPAVEYGAIEIRPIMEYEN